MMLKSLEFWTSNDIVNLVRDGVQECCFIDYKISICDNAKKFSFDLLKDICFLANAEGGHLIYGVSETNGTPQRIEGISVTDTDELKLRLENIIRCGVQPLIPRVRMRDFKVNDLTVFVVEVPQSWLAPHMITHENRTCFYIRANSGNSPMKYEEIRNSFFRLEGIPTRVQEFVDSRLANPKFDGASYEWLIMHFVPVSSIDRSHRIDPRNIFDVAKNSSILKNYDCVKYNLNGVHQSSSNNNQSVQYFRGGAIEVLSAPFISPETQNGYRLVASQDMYRFIESTTERALEYFVKININTTICMYITLTGMNGSILATKHGTHMLNPKQHSFESYVIRLPDVQIDELESDVISIIREPMDILWQAAGFVECDLHPEY